MHSVLFFGLSDTRESMPQPVTAPGTEETTTVLYASCLKQTQLHSALLQRTDFGKRLNLNLSCFNWRHQNLELLGRDFGGWWCSDFLWLMGIHQH